MNNLKLRAALFTAMVFIVFATFVATLILAQHFQGTMELKYAVLAACFAWIGYVVYRIKLDELEADDRKITDIALRVAEKHRKS